MSLLYVGFVNQIKMKDMENMVFFSENGMTAKSASHVIELASERKRAIAAQLQGISLLDEEFELPASGTKTMVRQGIGEERVRELSACLEQIGAMDSIIAWLMEAIKAKEEMTKEVDRLTVDDWAKEKGVVYEHNSPKFEQKTVGPGYPDEVTKEQVLNSLPIKERNRYLSLNSMAAVYGTFIGKHGAFTSARNAMLERENNPVSIKGEGQDTTLYRYTASVPKDMVEHTLTEMQERHRELNAELNSILYKAEQEAKRLTEEAMAQYERDMQEYRTEYAKELAAHEELVDKWNYTTKLQMREFESWKREKKDAVQALKIVVPDALLNVLASIKQ